MIEGMNKLTHDGVVSFLIQNEKKEPQFYAGWERLFGAITDRRKEEHKILVDRLAKKYGIKKKGG